MDPAGSALHPDNRQSAFGGLLVLVGHVLAGEVEGLHDLIERRLCGLFASQHTEANGVDRLVRRERVTLDAWHLNESRDGVAGQAQVVFERHRAGVEHLRDGTAEDLAETACRHQARNPDFALATDLRTGE